MPLGSTVPAIEQRLVEADCVRKAPTATEFEPYILSRADAAPRRLETERPSTLAYIHCIPCCSRFPAHAMPRWLAESMCRQALLGIAVGRQAGAIWAVA